MSSLIRIIPAMLALMVPIGILPAQDSTREPAKLRVAVVLAQPFSFKRGNEYDGYAIRLWKYVTVESGIPWEFTYSGKAPDCLDLLVKGQVDAVVGPVSITSWREPLMDFSYPFYESGIGMLVPGQSGYGIPYLRFVLSWRLLVLAGILLIAVTINAHIIWLLERRKNPEAFPSGYLQGIAEAVWYSIGIVLVGYGDKEIRAGAGRIAAVIWMLAGVALYSYVMSSLISFVTVNRLTPGIQDMRDLHGKTVAASENSLVEKYLLESFPDAKVKTFPDLSQSLAALSAGSVAAVADDVPVLRYAMKQYPADKFRVLNQTFDKQAYAFALRKDSLWRKKVDSGLLKAGEDGYLEEQKQQWFGNDN